MVEWFGVCCGDEAADIVCEGYWSCFAFNFFGDWHAGESFDDGWFVAEDEGHSDEYEEGFGPGGVHPSKEGHVHVLVPCFAGHCDDVFPE